MAKRRQPTARAGKKLGRYIIERELGRGGMGVVYVAKDENLGRHVALKTTNVSGIGSGARSRNQRRQRFIREVKALAQVNHHNVVHVYDAGEADDPELGWLLFYSMQYVEGITLAQHVQKNGALSPGAAAAVCMQVALGLGAAHGQGIVHRDVKPANIFMTRDGRALIGDFGICKIEGSTSITRRDQLIGTPNYLAPEQILGEDISPATDVFALGALFYVVATNRPLRDRTDAASLLAEAPTNGPRDKVKAERRFPEGLKRVIVKALERDPKKRHKDGNALAEALSDYATRIPSEADERPKGAPPQLDTATSPFGSLRRNAAPLVMDTAEASEGSDASDALSDMVGTGTAGIDAVAQALLNEVEQSGVIKKSAPGAPKKGAALPVAQAESTVMFNLRQLEGEQAKPLTPTRRSLDSLPVAKAESTVMFNIKKMQDGAPPGAPVLNRPTPEPLLTQDDTPVGDMPMGDTLEPAAVGDDAFDEPTVQEVPAPASSRPVVGGGPTPLQTRALRPKAKPKVRAPRPKKPPRTGPGPAERIRAAAMAQRHLLLSAAAGLLAAVVVIAVVVAARSPERGPIRPALSAVDVDESAPKRLPSVCRGEATGKKAVRAAKAAYKAARQAKAADDHAAAMKAAARAIAADPRHVKAHYLYAQLAGQDDVTAALKSYRCVVELAPESPLAAKSREVITRFSKSKRDPMRDP